MTRIDFHTGVPDKLLFACKLLRKAAAQGAQVAVLTTDEAELALLDQTLWTFSEQDFIPHVRADDALAVDTMIILLADPQAELPHQQVLVNLGIEVPLHFARHERLIEIVSGDDNETRAGRARYRYYRERGYPLEHYPQERQ